MKKAFALIFALLSPTARAEEIDLTALVELQTAANNSLANLETNVVLLVFFCSVCAIVSCLVMGLVTWRLIMLSKNQREIF